MADLIQFPFTRLQYAAIDNPLYIGDVVAANQEILAAITAISGLGPTDFAILSGFTYTAGSPGHYTSGVFYFNGVWYFQPSTFNENSYLKANVTGIMPYTFTDSVTRNTYQVNDSVATGLPTGATPQFVGNMNQYRLGNKFLQTEITTLQTNTNLQVVQVPDLGSGYAITFTNDKSIFFAAATGSAIFTFNFSGAVPGTVVRCKWTNGSASVSSASGQDILLESGDFGSTGAGINVMTMLYAGVNDAGNFEVSLVLAQVTAL